jgi:hypothetical protein
MAIEKKYKITTFVHLMKNNKQAKSGDIVSASEFVDLARSLKGNFCKEVESEKKKSEEKESPKKK